jgi:hypothetical protein
MIHHHPLPSWFARVAIADLLLIVALIAVCWWLNRAHEAARQAKLVHWDEED